MGDCLSCCRPKSQKYAEEAPETPDAHISVHDNEPVMCLCVSNEGIVSGGDSNCIVVHDINSGVVLRRLNGHSRGVNCVTVSNNRCIYSGSRDKTVKQWGSGDEASHTFAGHELVVTAVAVSPDDHCLASGSRDATVRLWDTETGTSVKTCKVIRNIVTSMDWLDDHTFVQASEDLKVRLWDCRTGDVVNVMEDGALRSIPLCCRSSGSSLAVTYNGFDSVGCEVTVWDIRQGVVQRVMKGHKQAVYCVTWMGDRLVTGSKDSEVKVWSTECIETRTMNSGPILSICATNDDNVVCGAFNGTISNVSFL